MKKFLILFSLVSLLVLVLGPIFPYWLLMLGVIMLSYLTGAGKLSSFFSAGLSFGLTWYVLALYISIKTDSALPKRMAELMGLGSDGMLLLATSILGFIIGSFSSLTGTLLRNLSKRKVY